MAAKRIVKFMQILGVAARSKMRVGMVATITDDADDIEQVQIAVHVAELEGAADRILAGPARAGERFADHGGVRHRCTRGEIREQQGRPHAGRDTRDLN